MTETRQKIQLALIAALVISGGRTGYILYHRHEDRVEAEKQKKARDLGYSNPDYYVVPKKLHPYDLKSAKQLTQQPVWVREGSAYTYYPYDGASKKVDFAHSAGLLHPIEKLEIKDVVMATPPGGAPQPQVMAVFRKDGKSYAVPIGAEADDQYKIYSDDLFFIEDPHELYKHWPADVWQAIDRHEAKPGMTEMQADFALGIGVPDTGGSSYEKTVRYANSGNPLVIVYHNGKAAEITAGSPAL